MSYEVREITYKIDAETREEGSERFIHGVIPYNRNSEDMGFIEIIKPGAFTKTIKEGDPRALWNHRTQYVLGKVSNGNLTFEDRDDGLHFDIKVPTNRSYADDCYDVIKSKDADGVSFGFRTIKDNWIEDETRKDIRELLEVELIEVSVGVTFPAYPNSKAQTRAFNEATGINLTELAKIIVRASNEKELDHEEVNFMTKTINQLRNLIGEEVEPEPEEDHSEQEPVDTTLLRMQLDLLEKSFI
jgi:HK97 family phage prohead protease